MNTSEVTRYFLNYCRWHLGFKWFEGKLGSVSMGVLTLHCSHTCACQEWVVRGVHLTEPRKGSIPQNQCTVGNECMQVLKLSCSFAYDDLCHILAS